MKTFSLTLKICLCSILSINFACCKEDEELCFNSENLDYEKLYYEASNIPTYSLLEQVSENGRAGNNSGIQIPVLTESDLDYLASLSFNELKSLRDDVTARLGEGSLEIIDEIEYENYLRIYNLLEGHKGVDKLLDFGRIYLETPGGWQYVESSLPQKVSVEQAKLYIGMSIYIDKIARPILLKLDDSPKNSRGLSMCRMEAESKLLLYGFDIGFEAFVDIMTGGAGALLTELEAAYDVSRLTSIWLEYEVCMGRQH